MISSEVQRTLVKSPPELWAELSDPTSLARHLGELGEIRITRTEPERTVEWEAADTTGKVLLKQSGWGTKVTLIAAREIVAPEPPAVIESEPESATELESATEVHAVNEVEPEAETVATEPVATPEAETVAIKPVATAEPETESVTTTEPEAEAIVEEPMRRPGFFARLFGRRPKEQAPTERPTEPEPTAEPELTAEPEPAEEPESELTVALQPAPEQETTPQDAPTEDTPPADIPDIAAELKAVEETVTAEVTAVLTAVLDRLGAAHHRPFSRS